MFRGERVKAPGVFGADHLEDESALLMREAVQNSLNAAGMLMTSLPSWRIEICH